MEETYKKGKGNAGLDGVQFQLNLVIVFLLNALRTFNKFKISTENQEAAKFDDIVMELPDGSAYFLQAKSRVHRKITKDQLFSTTAKKADFSLLKYFFEYMVIKKRFNVRAVIICTNADIDEKSLEDVLIQKNDVLENMLSYEEENCSYLTFSDRIISELKDNAKIYHDKNLNGKNIDKADISDENIKEFLNKLQFITNYPSREKLNKIIEQLLYRLNNFSLLGKMTHLQIYKKIEDWFKQQRGEYLTEARAKAIFCEIRSDKYCDALGNYNMLFKQNDSNLIGSKRIIHVIAEGGYLLPVLKVYHTLKDDEGRKLYVNPDDDIAVQQQVLEAFESCQYVYLIVIWYKISKEMLKEMCYKLKGILEKNQYKKVIVVTEGNKKLVQQIGEDEDIFNVDGSVTFQDLSKDSQLTLVKKYNINFQGKLISLEKLLKAETIESYGKALNPEMLQRLTRGEEIKVGVAPLALDKDTARYYINRSFHRKTSESTQKKSETIPEELIFDLNDKIILISNSAGMGKSTVLSKLSVDLKQRNPQLWVIKINLNDCTTILRDSLREGNETITITELLSFKHIKNQLEKFVFNIKEKVVLMFDGVDEISPDYTSLILNLLTQCQEAPNLVKIIITTRPHMTRELEIILKVKPLVLQPLTDQNQIDFLTNYWMYNLDLDNTKKVRCTKYAKAVLRKMYSWTNIYDFLENHFAAVPLQVRMLAETFQENILPTEPKDSEGCREFLIGEEDEPRLPEKVNTNLYDMFINKKRDAFITKGSPNGNTAANKALDEQFNECLAYHRNLALEVTLEEAKLNLFTTYCQKDNDKETNLLKIGIVQKINENYYFVHRTFAEYFVAQTVSIELLQNDNAEFQRFLIDEIFLKSKYMVVRGFLDNFLKSTIDSLPSNIFNNYQSLTYESKSNSCIPDEDLIFVLVKEGCVTILQLILKSIDFSVIKNKEVCVIDYQKQIYCKKMFRRFRRNKSSNILTFLKYLTRKTGINIKDEKDCTPLHYAAEKGFTDMVKFLLKQGANVNSLNEIDGTPLHLAARWGRWDTVKYLVEQGAWINIHNGLGCTPLHLAALWDRLDTIKFLIDRGAEVNIKNNSGNTALHLTTQKGWSDTAKYLAEHGANVHITVDGGKTLLHLFAEKGELNAVKYLVKREVQVNVKDDSGNTALHLVSRWGRLDIAKFLVNQKAELNIKNNNGSTALHLAVQWNWLNTAKFLVERGADVNVGNGDGNTPLHLAAQKGWLNTAMYLVKAGADVDIRNDSGCTPLQVAVEEEALETLKFLSERVDEIKITNDKNSMVLFLEDGIG